MKKHIQQFTVNAYKGIHNLTLKDLNAINILVGNNNCGKTSILELISTLQNPQFSATWISCTRTRRVTAQSTTIFEGIYDLFPVENDEKTISYEFIDGNGDSHFVALHSEIANTQITAGEMRRLSGFSHSKKDPDDDVLEDTLCMYLSWLIDGIEVNKDIIYERQNLFYKMIRKKYLFARTSYISPNAYLTDTPDLSRVLSDDLLYQEMLNILKIFDEDVVGLAAIKDEKIPSKVEYKITKKNMSISLPLNSYGDGMKKAVFLLNSIVLAHDGILLIDEFETGIHNSIMDKMFSWLLESALQMNVQVFLTSHNKEAIDKVLRCNSDLQPFINVYTLYNYENTNHVRMLNCSDAINAEDNLGLELR